MSRARVLAAGLGLALLAAFGCNDRYDRGDYDMPTDPSQQFLVLTSEGSATTLPADGVSRLRLTARITPDSLRREIVFTTTAGKLVGGTGTTDTERTMPVDSSGRAVIELRSDPTPGTASVTARVKDAQQIAQSLQVTFTDPGPDALIRFVTAPTSAPADGATASTFVVAVSPQIPGSARTVTFETTHGSFVRGADTKTLTVPVAADNTATAVLYSAGEVGEARVRASVAGAAREVRIVFERALPDRLILALSKVTVADRADDKITVTATLLRELGTVTPGTEVLFEATRNDTGQRFGLFSASVATTDADGKATIDFTPAGSGYTGPATMTARAPNGRSASLTFQVVAAGG